MAWTKDEMEESYILIGLTTGTRLKDLAEMAEITIPVKRLADLLCVYGAMRSERARREFTPPPSELERMFRL